MAIKLPSFLAPFARDPIPFLFGWVAGGILAILIPVIQWNKKKQEYYSYYGAYIEYQNQQNNGDNNNNYNSYYPRCKWFQWSCRKTQYYYMQQNGSGDNENWTLPNWFRFLGGTTESEQRWMEENGMDSMSSGALNFVYSWTLVMFIAMLLFGGFAVYKKRPIGLLVVLLAVFAQFALLMLVLLAQGVIMTDDRDLEDEVYGWWGQLSVLMVYTNFWLIIFCVVFVIAFLVRTILERRNAGKDKTLEESAAYQQAYDAPATTATTSQKHASSSLWDDENSAVASIRALFGTRKQAPKTESNTSGGYTQPEVSYKSATDRNMVYA